jgi:hypothetical protein
MNDYMASDFIEIGKAQDVILGFKFLGSGDNPLSTFDPPTVIWDIDEADE